MASAPETSVPKLDRERIEVLHEMSGCLVTRYSDSTVIKTGRAVNVDEQSALELASQYGLPVPRVYDAGELDGKPFLRMDFVEGDRLDSVWPSMTPEEKSSICRQLREVITTMRSIPAKTGLIGSCSGGEARDCRHYTEYTGGPFADEATFNSSFYLDFVGTIPIGIRTALSQIRSDHRIVFSHGDLSQHNILVKDGRITGLIDWETAGWYPEHWEYIKFFDRHGKNRDWRNFAADIFHEVYHQELAHHQGIVRWQRP
ncbi:kinase-like protein [Decorospora gaudefroyi]|uniref:Kinase-like protein n=1 Tax=Decorospora gaudefroyi TaxID=184978 RepID=A0A6A5K2H8_9PLEO|nr:kinase-like protein [Decorospora gaudefroyi]